MNIRIFLVNPKCKTIESKDSEDSHWGNLTITQDSMTIQIQFVGDEWEKFKSTIKEGIHV